VNAWIAQQWVRVTWLLRFRKWRHIHLHLPMPSYTRYTAPSLRLFVPNSLTVHHRSFFFRGLCLQRPLVVLLLRRLFSNHYLHSLLKDSQLARCRCMWHHLRKRRGNVTPTHCCAIQSFTELSPRNAAIQSTTLPLHACPEASVAQQFPHRANMPQYSQLVSFLSVELSGSSGERCCNFYYTCWFLTSTSTLSLCQTIQSLLQLLLYIMFAHQPL
jgi:hypothetical protein